MSETAIVKEPLRLDIVADDLMGKTEDGALEALLAANPGLAAQGPYIVPPRPLVVPPTPIAAAAAAVNPWD